MDKKTSFDPEIQQNIDAWLKGEYDAQTKEAIREMIRQNPQEIVEAFYTSLSFGTAGLRGIMGVGSNRMNVYTVRMATQGLANYLLKQPFPKAQRSVIIGYDSRINSRKFAEETARVLAGNGIQAYLYRELRPVPMVSFGVRYKNCAAGVMITASHNPKAYNGYKVFWSEGAQVLPPHDTGIIQEVKRIVTLSMIKMADLTSPLIEMIDDEIDKAYIQTIRQWQTYPEQNKKSGSTLKIVYTPLHGAGGTMIPKTLSDWGFSQVLPVAEQFQPDGNFPTVVRPNPEEADALKLGIKKLLDSQADLLLATDPDTDRIGVVINHKGQPVTFNGNEAFCIALYHLCQGLDAQKKLPAKAAFAKSIVTSELFKAIAEGFGKPCKDVLTGFKYIGQQIEAWTNAKPPLQYIFGAEESYGCLLGTHARDKDAIVAAALFAEVALNAKLQQKTLLDILYEAYQRFGIYREKETSLQFPESKEGHQKIENLIHTFRSHPPTAFANIPVKVIEDYQTSTRHWLADNRKETLELPQTEMLLFRLEDESKVIVRPSGTEPKIKLYIGVVNKQFTTIPEGIQASDAHIEALLADLKKHLA